MKRDQKLVILFLNQYNQIYGSSFEVREWPEQVERNKPAVEAIAINDSGTRLAIEHTLLQPFVGEKDDTQRFLAVIGSIEKAPAVRLPGHMVTVMLHVGSIPKGVDWSKLNTNIREWLIENIAAFPMKLSEHVVPNLAFELRIGVDKMDIRDDEGKIFFSRNMPSAPLSEVMIKAMSKKLPKLINTEADQHILILEQDNFVRGYHEIHETIGTVGKQFPELEKVDEIWLIDTVAWESANFIAFSRVWPDLVFERDGKLE